MTAPAWTASHPVSNPVALYDGRTVASDSEAWREWCQVRAVLAMLPDDQLRFYRTLERIRGPEARAALEARCAALEAHYVALLPDRDHRQAYLARVARTRGQDAKEAVEWRAREIFAARVALRNGSSA